MSFLDTILGKIFSRGSELELQQGLDFVSPLSASVNPATKRIEVTSSGGGGGSGHTIEDEGAPLVSRTSLNFVGAAVSAADAGGKTVVTIDVPAGYVKADGTVPLTATWALGNQSLAGAKTISFSGEVDNGNSSTADTVNWSAGSLQKSTLTGNCTFTFSNLVAGTDYRLKLIQDGVGSRTVTWPTTTWLGGSAPTLATAAAAVDFVSFYYDGMTLWGSAGVVSDFGSRVVRTTGQFVGATSGTPTPLADGGSFESCTTGPGPLRGLCHRQASADTNGAGVVLQKSRGTHASPAAVAADDNVGSLVSRGHDGSAFYDAGTFRHVADAAGGASKRTRAESLLHNGTALVTTEAAVQQLATTTDATLTVVKTIALAADSVMRVTYGIVGAQSSSSNRAIRTTTVTVRRSGSGDPAVVAYADACPLFKDDATWGNDTEIGHQINTTSDSLEIVVKGKAATTVAWMVDVQYGAR